MNNLLIALFAYLIDRRFGEFQALTHPVVMIGDIISFFEKKFYKDSTPRGCMLVLFVLFVVGFFAVALYLYLNLLPTFFNIAISSLIASMFLAHKMLYDSVKNILHTQDKKEAISMLVSRDTQNMSESNIYKAAIETYAENLSDGVIAPLFYLLLFNLPGIIIYKAVNTMDSMVGYRDKKYEKFGKCAAKLDDILNYIPSRLTAILIMLLNRQKKIFSFYKDGKEHDSPNAGHPITAMALSIGVKLGGDTSYFGKIKEKATFGEGEHTIDSRHLKKALATTPKVSKAVVFGLLTLILLKAFVLNF